MAIPNKAVQQLRQLALTARSAGLTDTDLLQQFVRQRDELAFETLVHRHGSLVLGVCRRRLRNRHDAEDAFQATFLVLARQAGSIRKPTALASWLHGVAHRTALALRNATRRRRLMEAQAMPRTENSAADTTELCAVLDQELAALPEKYRVAILLCDLEGKLHKQVARDLGCAEGTLASRLVRGRRLLAARLTQRGLTLSGGALAALLTQEAAAAGVPAPLVAAVTALAVGRAVASTAVTTLTQGVLKMMLVNKLRAATALLLVLGALTAATGAFVLGQDLRKSATPRPAKAVAQAEAGLTDAEFIRKACLELRGSLPTDIEVHYFLQDRNQQKRAWLVDMLRQEARTGKKKDAGPVSEGAGLGDAPSLVKGLVVKKLTEEEQERLQGKWQMVFLKHEGSTATKPQFWLEVEGNRLTMSQEGGQDTVLTYKLAAGKSLKIMRLTSSGAPAEMQWAYTWKGDRLRIAMKNKGENLPADVFKMPLAKDVVLMEFERDRVGEPALPNRMRGGPIVTSTLRALKIPVHVDPSRRAAMAQLKVFIFSEVQRESWCVDLLPNAQEFTFVAAHDGMYYFVMQIQDKEGSVEPADARTAVPDLRVLVDTSGD